MLEVGSKAPEFDLPIDGGGTLSSADLAGQVYVLYFYPRDNTSGCTTEACDFRDNWARVTATGATVIGVSKDSVKSHDKFKAKHDLPFPLISDTDKTLHADYGAWGIKKMYGKEVEGTIRSTFIVGTDGTILAAWPKVRVKGHVDAVLDKLAEITG
jgi:peroxiredoxin Q/BCP